MLRLAWTALLLAAAGGCVMHAEPIVPAAEQTPARQSFETFWQASLDVLREHYFEIDLQDRRSGTITTLPITARYGAEWWRRDAATVGDIAEGSIQTLYRSARVTIRPASPGAETFDVAVRVDVARSDRQVVQVTSTSEAFDLFRLPAEGRRRRQYLMDYGRIDEGAAAPDDERLPGTTPLGRDSELESKLVSDIKSLVVKRTGARM